MIDSALQPGQEELDDLFDLCDYVVAAFDGNAGDVPTAVRKIESIGRLDALAGHFGHDDRASNLINAADYVDREWTEMLTALAVLRDAVEAYGD